MLNIKDLIFSFCNTPTVSGIETKYSDRLFQSPDFDKTETDELGNRYFYKLCGKESAELLLIDAHFDEIGLMVSEILTDGFLRTVPVGSVDMRALPSERFTVYGETPIPAVAASVPPHLRSGNDGNRLTPFSDFLIDTGLDEETAKNTIRVGDRIGFEKNCGELLNNRVFASGLDNKACAAVAYYSLSRINSEELNFDVCLVLSSGEETGAVGSRAAVAKLNPSAVICLDSGFAEFPRLVSDRTLKLGEGIGISYSPALNRDFTDRLIEIARRNNIAMNIISENPTTGTNADIAEFSAGVPSALVSLPLSNMHTPAEVISIDDAEILSGFLFCILREQSVFGGDSNG